MTFTGKIVGAEMCPGDRTLICVEVPGCHSIQMSRRCILTIGAPSTPAPATGEPVKCGTFSKDPIPADVRARMDADRKAAERAAPSPVEEARAEGIDRCAECRRHQHRDLRGEDVMDCALRLPAPRGRCLHFVALRAPVESSTDGKGGGA